MYCVVLLPLSATAEGNLSRIEVRRTGSRAVSVADALHAFGHDVFFWVEYSFCFRRLGSRFAQ